MSKQSIHLRRIVISALFLAAALSMRFFSIYIPVFGAGGMRVGVSAVFSIPPAILFGPFYGLTVSALNDVFGFMIRPTGAYLPLMTLVHAATGFIRGWLWLLLRGRDTKKMRIAVMAFAVVLLTFSVSTIVMLRIDGITPTFYENIENPAEFDTGGLTPMGRFIITRSQGVSNPSLTLEREMVNITRIPLFGAGFAFLLLVIDLLISRFMVKENDASKRKHLLPLLITMLLSGLFLNTLNTVILRQQVFTSWQEMPFVVVWLPRAAVMVVTYSIITYLISILLEVCERQKMLQPLLAWNRNETDEG